MKDDNGFEFIYNKLLEKEFAELEQLQKELEKTRDFLLRLIKSML